MSLFLWVLFFLIFRLQFLRFLSYNNSFQLVVSWVLKRFYFYLYMCVSVCTCVQLPADQKKLSGSLALKLQGIVSLLTWIFQELMTAEPSLQPSLGLLNVWGEKQAIFACNPSSHRGGVKVTKSLKTSLDYLVGHTYTQSFSLFLFPLPPLTYDTHTLIHTQMLIHKHLLGWQYQLS